MSGPVVSSTPGGAPGPRPGKASGKGAGKGSGGPPASEAPDWGAYAPSGFQRALLRHTRAAPAQGLGRLSASLARNIMLAGLSRPIDEMAYGTRVRFHPKDNLADKRALFFPDVWDVMEREAIADVITPAFTFIDIGANSGLYSLFVASRAPKNAVIIAVEPQPGMKERLAFNIAANGFANVRHADVALAEGPGETTLTIAHANRGASSISRSGAPKAAPGSGGVTVPTVGLLDLMDFYEVERADAIKIDIEGAEDRVLPAFFEQAPRRRFPSLMVMETLSKTWKINCVELAFAHGYQEVARNPRNIVLAFDADRPEPIGLARRGMI